MFQAKRPDTICRDLFCRPRCWHVYAYQRARNTRKLGEMGKIRKLGKMVGARGFEPRASCAQGRRATRLRYAPTNGD